MSDDITPVPMSKSEAWDLTDSIRTDLETAYDAIERAKVSIPIARDRLAWQSMGYESMEEYVETEFGEMFQALRIKVDDRMQLVDVLSDSGMSNRQIASTLGVNEKTIRNDLRKINLAAENSAPLDEETAGQDVEEVGLIDSDGSKLLVEPGWVQPVTENLPTSSEDNKDTEVDRFAGINFDAMLLGTPNQIVEADPTPDTPDYFVPRPVAPSWSPPLVSELPPPSAKRYDDDQPEFLDEPMTIEKPKKAHHEGDKHCRTCACNLLP